MKTKNTPEQTPSVTQQQDRITIKYFIDVRTHQEFDAGHEQGAINIPVEELSQQARLLLPNKNDAILIYAQSAKQADQARDILYKMGYAQVIIYHAPAVFTPEPDLQGP